MNDQPDVSLQRASALHDSGKIAEAIDAYQKSIDTSGATVASLNGLGKAQAALQDFEAARLSFESAIKLKGDFVEGIANLAGTHRLVGNLQGAEEVLLEGLSKLPGNFSLHMELGHLYLAQSRLGEAQYQFQEAATTDPKQLSSLKAVTHTYFLRNDFDGARWYLFDRLSEIKFDPVLTPMRAEVARRMGDLQTAEEQALSALNANPENSAAAVQLVLTKFDAGQTQEAAELIEVFQGKGLFGPDSRLVVAQHIVAIGQTQLAEDYLMNSVIPAGILTTEAHVDLGARVAAQILPVSDNEDLFAWFDQQCERPAASSRLRAKRAQLYLIRSMPDRAAELARQLTQDDPTNIDNWCCLAEANLLLGGLEDAQDNITRAMQLNPESGEANLVQAHIAHARKDKTAALSHLEVISKTSPGNSFLISSAGELKLRMGCFDTGWSDFSQRSSQGWLTPQRQFLIPKVESLAECSDRSVYVWAEWGLGEQLLMAPLVLDLIKTAKSVTLECDPRLVDLLTPSLPDVAVCATPTGADIDGKFDLQMRLSDLAQWFRASETAFPNHSGYLVCQKAALRTADEIISKAVGADKTKIGISWASTGAEGLIKSLPLDILVSEFEETGLQLVNLQHGEARDYMGDLASDIATFDEKEVCPAGDISGFVSLVQQMDHIVTISNTTAHIAGALGKSADVLVPRYRRGLWHWQDYQPDSLWYPSLKVHFFETLKEAEQILHEVAARLRTISASSEACDG